MSESGYGGPLTIAGRVIEPSRRSDGPPWWERVEMNPGDDELHFSVCKRNGRVLLWSGSVTVKHHFKPYREIAYTEQRTPEEVAAELTRQVDAVLTMLRRNR